MSGASIETTLELWAASLRDVKARMRPLFKQARMAVSAVPAEPGADRIHPVALAEDHVLVAEDRAARRVQQAAGAEPVVVLVEAARDL